MLEQVAEANERSIAQRAERRSVILASHLDCSLMTAVAVFDYYPFRCRVVSLFIADDDPTLRADRC